jgi:hypothetical protein
MKSKTALFRDLAELIPDLFADAPKTGLHTKGISDETYGKESFIYVNFRSREERKDMEEKLRERGWKPDRRYCPEGTTTEVPVSYFKGWHWDE